MTTERHTLSVDKDGVLTFTEEFLETTGWREGTELEFIDNGDGSVTMKEVVSDTDDEHPG